jgi:hypothetical protein
VDLVARLRQQHHDDARDPHVAVARQLVGILSRVEQCEGQGLRITPGVARHLPEFPQHIEQARTGLADRTSAQLTARSRREFRTSKRPRGRA